FAHRKCIQRWCNKKGDITCEICKKDFSPNYSLPPTRSNPDVLAIDIRQAWSPHIDLRDSHLLVLTASQSQLLQSEYEDYVAANSGSLACLRLVALILLIILLLRQVLMLTRDSGTIRESSTFINFQVLLLQFAGFLLPCYVVARTCLEELNLNGNALRGRIASCWVPALVALLENNTRGDYSGSVLSSPNSYHSYTFAEEEIEVSTKGPLPDRKVQFGTFDESSYEGNPLLCGLPLNKSCNGSGSPVTPSDSSREEEGGLMDMDDFYISFAVTYAIIFLATVLVLYINPYRRQVSFNFVKDCSSISCYFFIADTCNIRNLTY
ncbi:hypothetical protein V6N11_039699, partial [Hibiscus sabdariffa]